MPLTHARSYSHARLRHRDGSLGALIATVALVIGVMFGFIGGMLAAWVLAGRPLRGGI
jgi:hypothetical protein